MPKKNTKKRLINFNISYWRVGAYFFIYSFVGYLIETIFAILWGGVWECRQSFLYGPFCSIYGVGAVALIIILSSKFSKNNYTLFLGGTLLGSITEYLISMFGEFLLGIKWWDYTGKFLNINGRICLIYSFVWGLLSLFLIKWLNPRVDKVLNFLQKKVGTIGSKWIVSIGVFLLLIDALISSLALNYFQIRVVVENDLAVENREKIDESYNKIYVENEKLRFFIDKYWDNDFMILTYPNLTIDLANGDVLLVRQLYPDIKPYYFNFNKSDNNKAIEVTCIRDDRLKEIKV